MLRLLLVAPNENPVEVQVPHRLEELQSLVDGYIEAVKLGDYILVCNEEGLLKGLPFNRNIGGYHIVGTCFITKGDDYGEFVSLTDEDIADIKRKWFNY